MSMGLQSVSIPSSDYLPDLAYEFFHYEALKARLKAKGSDHGLEREFLDTAQNVTEKSCLVRMTPDTDPRLILQMFQDEKVHPVATLDKFVATRIAAPGMHKAAFALAAKDNQGPRGLAAIYTRYDRVALTARGNLLPEALRGDIHVIKDEIPQEMGASFHPNIVYFYTVTSKVPKAAYVLVGRVGRAHKAFAKSTISPVRTLTSKLDMDAFDGLDLLARKTIVANYIATREGFSQMDPVAFFHMDNGNGAYLADIKFNPGKPGDRVMANYFYPSDPEVSYFNQKLFRAGYVPMDRHLWDHLPEDKKSRVSPIDAPLRAGGNKGSAQDAPSVDR